MGFKRSWVRIPPARFFSNRRSIVSAQSCARRGEGSRVRIPLATYNRFCRLLSGLYSEQMIPPVSVQPVHSLIPRREISDNFFETRVAAQRVPVRVEFQVAVAQTAWNSQG